MRSRMILCLIFCVFPVLIGYSITTHAEESLAQLEFAGRYGDMARVIEARLSRGEQADSTLLSPLCMAYGKLKRFDKLFDCVTRLEARIAGGDRSVKSDEYFLTAMQAEPVPGMLLAAAYLDLGDYPRSLKEGERALATLPDKSIEFSMWPPIKFRLTILPGMVVAATLGGDRVQARKYLAQLEGISIPFIGGAIYGAIKSNELARAYLSLGEYAKVVENLGSRGVIFNFGMATTNTLSGYSSRGDDVFTTFEVPRLFMLAKAQTELGKLTDAKVTFGKLFEYKRLPENGEIYWLTLNERGHISAAEGDAAGATEYWQQAVEVIEQQRSTINTEASKIGFVGDKQAVYARLIAALIEQGRVAEAFDYVERSKSRALVDMLATKKDFAAPNAEQTKLVLAQLDAVSMDTHAQSEGVETQPTGIRNLQLARQALQSNAPELSSLVTVTSVPSTELKSLVGTDETLIEYYYQGKDLYAFILDRERLQAVRMDASELDAQVQYLRKTLEEPNSSAWQEASRKLYQRLWQPLEKLVTSKDIIVVAHGALHYLPFSALQDGEGRFLIDRYDLRFLPSASVLKYLRPVMQKNDAPLLVFGNPDLDDPALDLQFAEDEAKLVGAMNPKSRVLLRKEASESNFKKAGGLFTRIHFATHGKFQADDPLKSGLYLAKDADNDGVLTVGELYSMKLEADLITLSACETGLGKVANGDDVVGLTRGFLYAGSRSIVASLWSVDDKATAVLMQAFYTNLASMNKMKSLRQAQIKAREAFPHPFYWAAFQLTGRAD